MALQEMLTLTNKEVEGYLETVISKYLEYPEYSDVVGRVREHVT